MTPKDARVWSLSALSLGLITVAVILLDHEPRPPSTESATAAIDTSAWPHVPLAGVKNPEVPYATLAELGEQNLIDGVLSAGTKQGCR